MPTYLVTGGAGFIGSNLVRALAARGERVRVLDDLSTGREENLAGLAAPIELVRGSVTDPDAVARAVEGVDFVLHQAAIPSVQRSIEAPLDSDRVNVGGTVTVLEAARRARVRRVVYAASSSAYGDTPVLPKVETMTPDPRSPYAVSKLAGEQYLRAYAICHGLESAALRYFNVFGPYQDPRSDYAAVIPRFIHCYLEGRPPTVFGDGEQTRDFCFIENVVAANLLACERPGLAGAAVNVACGERISLLGVLDLLAAQLGRRLEPRFEPARVGDVRDSLASIERARTLLGYAPAIAFAEGLRRTVEWYRARLGGAARA